MEHHYEASGVEGSYIYNIGHGGPQIQYGGEQSTKND
jgi:hypothetical protein